MTTEYDVISGADNIGHVVSETTREGNGSICRTVALCRREEDAIKIATLLSMFAKAEELTRKETASE